MRKVLPASLLFFAVAGLLAAAGSWGVERRYDARAKLVQRMQIDPADDLFGTGGTPIGSPQRMIIDDPKAFVGRQTDEGAEVIDEAYLKANGVYPLQMQTVSYVAGTVRGAGAAVALVAFAGWALARRKLRKNPLPSSP